MSEKKRFKYGPRTVYAAILPKSVPWTHSVSVTFADAYVPTPKPFAEFLKNGETVAEYSDGCEVVVWLAECAGTSLGARFSKNPEGKFRFEALRIGQFKTIDQTREELSVKISKMPEACPPLLRTGVPKSNYE